MILAAIAVAATAANAAGFSLVSQLLPASTKDTFPGQVANAVDIQIELNLQMNIAVNFALVCG